MKQLPYDFPVYRPGEWDRFQEDFRLLVGIVHDLSNTLDEGDWCDEDWDKLGFEGQQRYLKLFNAVKEFLGLQGYEGEKATEFNVLQMKRVLVALHTEKLVADAINQIGGYHYEEAEL